MRIGMLADIYKPYVSGVTSYISHSKRYLEGIGHEVMVFTFGNQHYQDEETHVYRAPEFPRFLKVTILGLSTPWRFANSPIYGCCPRPSPSH